MSYASTLVTKVGPSPFPQVPSAPLHTENVPEFEEQQATENIVSLGNTEEWERKKFIGDLNKFMAEIGMH